MAAPRKPRTVKITETQEQKTVVAYIRKLGFQDDETVWTHIRNERAGDWQRLEAWKMGVTTKLPDFHFLRLENRGWIEMKERGWKKRTERTGNYNTHELEQLEMHARLRRNGDWVDICETLEEVVSFLEFRGMPLRSESITTERIRRGFENAQAEAEG